MLPGLHQAEMALRQHQCRVTRDAAQHGQADGGQRPGHARAVPLAADAVQDHAADPHAGAVAVQAQRHGGGGLRLAGYVQHQQHRQAEPFGEVRRGAGAAGRRRHAVEQAHGALGDQEALARGGQVVQQGGRHGPAVQVGARLAGGGGVEGRVDVVGAGLRGADRDAAAAQGGDQAERDGGLAAAGARGGDEPALWRRHRAALYRSA